jgi:nucleotide-binding universal stress UspA family protein
MEGENNMSVPYSKILLPLDGSQFAVQALPHAEAIAGALGATLILFEVVEDPLTVMASQLSGVTGGLGSTGSVGIGALPPDENTHRKAMDAAQGYLDELAVSLKHRKIDAVVDINAGEPAERIVDYAAAQGVDLIVMSSHGRTAVKRWTYGSVASKVLQAASCPVLVVRPTESIK